MHPDSAAYVPYQPEEQRVTYCDILVLLWSLMLHLLLSLTWLRSMMLCHSLSFHTTMQTWQMVHLPLEIKACFYLVSFQEMELDLAPLIFPYTPVELNVAFVLIHSQIWQTVHSSRSQRLFLFDLLLEEWKFILRLLLSIHGGQAFYVCMQ